MAFHLRRWFRTAIHNTIMVLGNFGSPLSKNDVKKVLWLSRMARSFVRPSRTVEVEIMSAFCEPAPLCHLARPFFMTHSISVNFRYGERKKGSYAFTFIRNAFLI